MPRKQSLGQKPSTLKHQCIESELNASEYDSFIEADKKGADSDTAGLNNSEDDDLDVAARMLSDEVASLVTNSQKPWKSSKVSDSGADHLSATDRKRVTETLTWGDVDDAVLESVESITTSGELLISSDNEGAAKLV
ncbi:hypothetical protein EV424DRAFT_1342863 [Suillus variegatus]|nr:hypothetical protein EV424DRAFT_1342863 [Suillus variegatus]